MSGVSGLTKLYFSALQKYLDQSEEVALKEAYELGRKAIGEGLGVLDMTKVHQEALLTCLDRAPTLEEGLRIARAAGNFFTESLSAFEMTHRGFREANRTLHELNRTLEQRAAELAAVNRELQNEITERQNAEDSLRKLSGRLLRLQDEERRRMARELHDTTGQTLAALALNLYLIESGPKRKLDEHSRKALSESLALAEQCSREIRTMSYLLHPPLLDELGLAAVLRWYSDGFSQRSGIRVDLQIPSKLGRLPQDVEMTLFRIVQEGLTNIHRHSGSKTAKICVSVNGDGVALEVVDQGRGIPPEKLERGRGGVSELGVGIAGMRERVRQLGGRLEIRSDQDGTTVKAVLPCIAAASGIRQPTDTVGPIL